MQEKKVIQIKQDTSNGARESTASNVKLLEERYEAVLGRC